MARNRAQRRANSRRHQDRRRRIFGLTEDDRRNGNSLACGGKMTPGGEAKACRRCETCKAYEREYFARSQAAKLSAWIKSHTD